jgi:hypothetical protein
MLDLFSQDLHLCIQQSITDLHHFDFSDQLFGCSVLYKGFIDKLRVVQRTAGYWVASFSSWVFSCSYSSKYVSTSR